MSVTPSDQPLAPFHGRYVLERELKSGGMGIVYSAVDLRTNSRVAVKTMNRSEFESARLETQLALEACITGPVESDHIVRVIDAGIDAASKTPFLVMEFLNGRDLDDILEKSGKLLPADVVLYLRQAAFAIDKSHDAGIVHRDLKPANLFLTTRDDGSAHVKVLDFGVAKVMAQSSNAKTTRIAGSPMFMSPEQVEGKGNVNGAADIYALGHVAFALLVGKPYWEPESSGGVHALLNCIVRGIPESASARARRFNMRLTESFDEWFICATASQPTQRFATAGDLVAALAAALGEPLPKRDSQRSSTPD